MTKWSSEEDVKAYQKKYREKNKGTKKTRFNKFVKVNYINADDMYYNVKIKKDKIEYKDPDELDKNKDDEWLS